MIKPKLTTAQNLQLKDLSLQEKLNLLHDWKKSGEISQQVFEHFSNLWIKKESKKMILEKNPLRRRAGENLEKPSSSRLAVEGEINVFISKLRRNLKSYISERNVPGCKLSDEEMAEFQKFVRNYFRYCRLPINQLLILGLRYPDKELNSFCAKFIQEHKKNALIVDYYFWGSLWEDTDFVPLDAVRLMVVKINGNYEIDKCFDAGFIKSILPLIEAQRDKEALRLTQAQMLEGKEREQQVARKMHRLNAFNLLIDAAQKYK